MCGWVGGGVEYLECVPTRTARRCVPVPPKNTKHRNTKQKTQKHKTENTKTQTRRAPEVGRVQQLARGHALAADLVPLHLAQEDGLVLGVGAGAVPFD